MSALRLTDWKRWIATLCVVLVAFVMVERAYAADPCHSGQSSVSYNIASATALVAADSSSDDQNSLPPEQQHCCSAHVAAMLPVPHASALSQAIVLVQPPRLGASAPHGEQDGQHRPPRAFAVA